MPIHDIPELFLQIRDRHGHYCPMSTLGGRLGQAALQALQPSRVMLMARYLHDTCAVDGIALATGCLPEEGRLTVFRSGHHRLELWEVASGRGVGAELTAVALELAASCRRLQDEGPEAVAAAALAELRCAPLAELVSLEPLSPWGTTADA